MHIDDNTGVILQYNDEKAFIDNWRTRQRPHDKVQDIVMVNSLTKGAVSDAFAKQFELLSDAIIDIKSQEKEGHTTRKLPNLMASLVTQHYSVNGGFFIAQRVADELHRISPSGW